MNEIDAQHVIAQVNFLYKQVLLTDSYDLADCIDSKLGQKDEREEERKKKEAKEEGN